jgi:hypothetical protein
MEQRMGDSRNRSIGLEDFCDPDALDDPPRRRMLDACPKCGTRVLWTDGEPTPGLVYRQPDGTLKLIDTGGHPLGCETCLARKRAPAEPPPRPRVVVEMPRSEAAEKPLRDEFFGVVDWVSEGLTKLERLGRFLRKL